LVVFGNRFQYIFFPIINFSLLLYMNQGIRLKGLKTKLQNEIAPFL